MKEFFKMALASFTAMMVYGLICFLILMSISFGLEKMVSDLNKPVAVSSNAILTINMSQIAVQEQTQEPSLLETLAGTTVVQPMGVINIAAAINAAAMDPDIRCILLRPDGVYGGIAQIEEVRNALALFRESGKAVISYIENPSTGGYYLASVSDKIYMTPHDGGVNTFQGMSSQMIFLKDALDQLGVNVQLVRHGKFKAAGEMFVRNSSSKENMLQNQEMIRSLWGSWCSDIAKARDMSCEEINSMLDDMVLNQPEDFLKNGLVDALMTEEQLQKQLAIVSMNEDPEQMQYVSLQDYARLIVPGNPEGKDKIAVIYANGNIVEGYGVTDVAGDRYVEIIQEIRKDKAVKAVVLRVNSPGGSVLASEKIKAQIDSLAQKIPVIASYGNEAASGGYWISSGCDYIYTNETTLTGSIGVFSLIPDFKNTINDILHVNVAQVNSNKHSDMYDMMRPLTEKELEIIQMSVDNISDRFNDIVAESRNMTLDYVDSIAQGRVWTGAEAVRLGLADQIGTLQDALMHAALLTGNINGFENIQVVEYPQAVNTMDALRSLFSEEEMMLAEPLQEVKRAFDTWNGSQSGKVYARMPYVINIK